MLNIEFKDCADEKTPEGAFAYVGCEVANNSGLGYWTKIGSGAKIGYGSRPGNWSNIGHFAKIGNGVTFGPWSGVGIDAVVDSGCVLGHHEYVRGGYRRRRDGRQESLRLQDGEDGIRGLYDMWATAIPSGCYSNDEYARMKEYEAGVARMLADALPGFLARRKIARPVGWWQRLIA